MSARTHCCVYIFKVASQVFLVVPNLKAMSISTNTYLPIVSKNLGLLYLCLLSASCTLDHGPSDFFDEPSSSVWCTREKLCTFQNLCFHSESNQFLFVLSAKSVFHGLAKDDLKQLELSSIRGHNRMFMNIAVVSQVNEIIKTRIFRNESLFVMQPFKRDNIMHVIHDDLLPLFSTYLEICGGDITLCVQKYRLAFTNVGDVGPYAKWYKLFSQRETIILSRLQAADDAETPVVCYEEVRVGLSRASLWYDYGFSDVQGRINSANITGQDVRAFRDYVLRSVGVTSTSSGNDGCAILIKRTRSRRILNDQLVRSSIIESLESQPRQKKVCLLEMDMSSESSEVLLDAVARSPLLVGMHGAGMALALFLPLGASIVELFPFAIDPYSVSPTMALCDLRGMGFHYATWRNRNRSSSLPPSSAEPLEGSIAHLPTARQDQIRELDQVTAVRCCHDPAYLFYMFHDTLVSHDFGQVVTGVLQRAQDFYIEDFLFDAYVKLKRHWMSPGPVYNVACDLSPDTSVIQVSWTEPINSAEIDVLHYEVTVVAGEQQIFEETVNTTNVKIPYTKTYHKLKVWVCAGDETGRTSRDVYAECDLDYFKI